MKHILITVLALALIASCMPSFAAWCEHGVGEDAWYHRVGDWIATIGKSDMEKKTIIAERKAKRAAACAQKEAEKLKKQADREAQKMQKDLKGVFNK